VFTRPTDLADADVRAALEHGWGLEVVTVEHAPVGFGSHHWWVGTDDGRRWFATADDLRLRRHTDDEPLAAPLERLRAALTTATALREHGLEWSSRPAAPGRVRSSSRWGRRSPCAGARSGTYLTEGLTTVGGAPTVVVNQTVYQGATA